MQQFRLVLAVLMFAGSDAFFLNLFKSKVPPPQLPQSYSYNQQAQPYQAQPAPYEPYKIPVWQAVPSGYMAQPVSTSGSYSNQGQSQSYGYSAQDVGYGGASYNAPYSPPASYNAPPAYDAPVPVYESGNGVTGSDYTGSSPMISVPVYFPKDSANAQPGSDAVPIPSTYSNGVSGFYDSSLAGSSSVNVVGQAVPVHVPISGASSTL